MTLRIGETAAPAGAPAGVTVDGVTDDSRCPSDATCVWAGDVSVAVTIHPRRGDDMRVVLRLASTDARSADAAGLHLRLDSVEPQPRTGYSIPAAEYRVRLSIAW